VFTSLPSPSNNNSDNGQSAGSYFDAVAKSESQSPESSRTNPETTGSPTTLCPAV